MSVKQKIALSPCEIQCLYTHISTNTFFIIIVGRLFNVITHRRTLFLLRWDLKLFIRRIEISRIDELTLPVIACFVCVVGMKMNGHARHELYREWKCGDHICKTCTQTYHSVVIKLLKCCCTDIPKHCTIPTTSCVK